MTPNGNILKTVIFQFLVVIITIGISWLCAGCATMPFQNDQDNVIETVLEWGRLAPFPKSAQNLSFTTEGSMFTRAFRINFSAPCEDIEIWLAQSPGTSEIEPKSLDNITFTYIISPGGGAQHAEVTISKKDQTTCTVEIFTYWS
jgi:hypothetical protein